MDTIPIDKFSEYPSDNFRLFGVYFMYFAIVFSLASLIEP